MTITRGPYSANIDPVYIAGRRQIEYQVVVCRYRTPVYVQSEDDFEEAMRVAKAYVEWESDQYTDA